MSKPRKSAGWRGSEELWLKAAYEILIESGVDAVKVMTLAKRLNLSRTSFYWHFEDRDTLLNALIGRWQEKNTGNLISQTRAYAETITEAMLNLFDCWLNPELFDARFDVAIRSWGQQDPKLKAIIEEVDTRRVAAIRAMFKRFGFRKAEAETRALTVYYTQVGYISLMVREPASARIRKMPGYVEIFTGIQPSKAEIRRFASRHQENPWS